MTPAGLIDYEIADITLAIWGHRELITTESEIPALMGLRRRYAGQQLLKGTRILGYVHMTTQTGVLVETLIALDAEVRWSSCNIFSTQDQVTATIVAADIPVFAWKDETEEEYEWRIEQTILKDGQSRNINMVLGDGGNLTETLYKKYPRTLERIHGITEKITAGVHRLFDMLKSDTLKVPTTNINDSMTKSKDDNEYDCCHSLSDTIKRGTGHLLSGKRALVIGYGDVGKNSSQSLRQEDMTVKVAEVDPICVMQAYMDGFEVVPPYKNDINDGTEANIDAALLGRIDLIVTTTGNVNVCGANMLRALKKRAVVYNIGHSNNKIDTAFTHKDWVWEEAKSQMHKVHRIGKNGFDAHNDDHLILLVESRLVDLGDAAGHPSRIMDGSLANRTLVQIHPSEQKYTDLPTAEKAKRLSVEVLPKKPDGEVALEMVKGFGGMVTQLTPKRAKYVGVSVEGPFKPDTYHY